jgi:hypothetical protein
MIGRRHIAAGIRRIVASWCPLACLAVCAPLHAQSLSSYWGELNWVEIGVPTTLLPVPSGDTTVLPVTFLGGGVAPQFTLRGDPGKEFVVWCTSRTYMHCGSVETSFRPDAMYWREQDRRCDPATPVTVRCDSNGVVTLDVGLSVTFSPDTRTSGAEAWINCFVADPVAGDTITTDALVKISPIIGMPSSSDGEVRRAVRGTTCTVEPGEEAVRVVPIRSGRETGVPLRFVVGDFGDVDVAIAWLLPETLRNDSGRTLPVTFSPDAGRVLETGHRFNPLVTDTFHISSTCAATLDLGFTVSIPADAAPGRYAGNIYATVWFIGNLGLARQWSITYPDLAIVVDVSAEAVPDRPTLAQNYPNPFNAGTVFSYFLPHPGEARLTLVDLLGRTVATVLEGYQTAGWHELRWQADGLPSGVYFYRLQAGEVIQTRKLLYLR